MSAILTNQMSRRLKGIKFFGVLTGVFSVVFLFIGLFEFIPAWILKDAADQPHLWHIAELSAIAVLLGGCMIGMLYKPEEKPLLAQFIVLSTVIAAAGIAPFFIEGLGILLITLMFVLAYPNRAALVRVGRTGRLSFPLLGVTAIFAIFLDPVIHQEIAYQIMGMTNDVHAMKLHWIGSALLMILLLLAGVMASTRRPGWQWLTVLTGLTYCFLGVIAMIVPNYAGSWAQWCGLMAIFGGVLYIFILFVEIERSKLRNRPSSPTPTLNDELYQVQQQRQLTTPNEAELVEL